MTDTADLLSGFAPEGVPQPIFTVQSDSVTMNAPPRTDLFIDPADPPGVPPSVGRIVTRVEGDFVFSARVEVGFHSTFDAGVLYVEHDQDRWFKLCLEFTPQARPSVVSVVTRGVSDDANAWLLDSDSVWLRVSRQAGAFALHASPDGQLWSLVRHFSLGIPPSSPVKVGLLAQSPTGDGCQVVFSDLRLAHGSLGDIRDGH
jgi:uncharacterized protein